MEYPLAKVSTNGLTETVESDFDGYFQLTLNKKVKKFDLHLDLNISSDKGNTENLFKDLKIIIKNIELNNQAKLDLGKILLPYYRHLEIREYEELKARDKKHCQPVTHYTELLGYEYSKEIDTNSVILFCETENLITDFKYKKKKKELIIEWTNIKCE